MLRFELYIIRGNNFYLCCTKLKVLISQRPIIILRFTHSNRLIIASLFVFKDVNTIIVSVIQ